MPALVSAVTVTSPGQLIESVLVDPVKLTVTVKLHVSPVIAVQAIAVLPRGKVEPDGGLQTTPLPPSGLEPQLPEVVGAA